MTSRPPVLTAVVTWLKGAPGWLGGALAGAQAALLSLAVVLVPAWVIVAAAPNAQGASSPDWGGATSASVRLWLLALGVPWDIGGVSITVPPLGLTALSAFMMVALARRFASKTWTSWLCAVGAFAGLIAFVTTLTWAGAEDTSRRALLAALIATMIAAPAAAMGIWRAHGATLAWVAGVPHAVRAGLRMAVALVGANVVVAALVAAVWAVVGRHAIAETASGLDPDAAGGISLAAMETLFAPTVMVWTMAWVTGTGFDVGLAHFAPGDIVAAPLPAIPLLVGLPSAAGGVLVWAPLLVLGSALVVRLVMRGRMPSGWARGATMAIATATTVTATAILGGFVTGAIGPGTLAHAGPGVGGFAAITGVLVGAGLLVGEVADRLGVLLGFSKDPTKRVQPAPARTGSAATPDGE